MKMFADDLETLANELGEIHARFQKPLSSFLPPLLSSGDEARLQLHAGEAEAILREAFGEPNDYVPKLRKVRQQFGTITAKDGVLAAQTILNAAAARLRREAVRQSIGASGTYVDARRLDELRAVKAGAWDLARLIVMLGELNAADASGGLITMALLQRAVLDHVPPIFGFKSFTEFANNYAGGKSLADQMKRLDSGLRSVADFYLHRQIRQTESLPTPGQVKFRSEFDSLLAEIWRVLR